MMQHKQNAPDKTAVLPFSNGYLVDSCLYVSGQGGIDRETGTIVGPDIESQTVTTMENIRNVLLEHDMDFHNVVKMNVYLSDRRLYREFNEIYSRYFRDRFPARTTIYCDLNYDLLVEIDAIAVAGKK